MPATAIIGAQFGDEGKGKITDFFAKQADIVVRYHGGNNAGHTVVVGSNKFKLHHVPSGVVHGKRVLIAAGVVIDPRVLDEEISRLPDSNEINLGIDSRAHIIMPWHNLQDSAQEQSKGSAKIGTTGRGIGPCYADKAFRSGIRFEDLADRKRLQKRMGEIFPHKKKLLEGVYGAKVEFTEREVFAQYSALGEKFSKNMCDASLEVHNALRSGKQVLFEGAQGTFLDNDFGTYPYVTSSHPISGSFATGIGISPLAATKIIGVAKAYTTRVGEGPFPTEIEGEFAKKLRDAGSEYGTTTGRPRRVGWLDLALLKTAHRLNGFTEIAITKLDVLSGLEKLKVCTSYTLDGKKIEQLPASTDDIARCKPNYEELEGFEITGEETRFADLQLEAREYLRMTEEHLGIPVSVVSIGAERGKTILR